jgi:16S rRNA (guanine966-N2)-methyltransferase
MARGRRLQTPSKSTAKSSGRNIRPTSDRAREALFNIIGQEVNGAVVLDLYAGTGALGLEALSRSASRAFFVDNCNQAIQIVEKNIGLCGFSDRAQVIKRDLSKGLFFIEKLLPEIKFDIIFVDPPYRKSISEFMLWELAKMQILSQNGLVIVEDDVLAVLPANISGLKQVDQRRYGDTGFWLYRRSQSHG